MALAACGGDSDASSEPPSPATQGAATTAPTTAEEATPPATSEAPASTDGAEAANKTIAIVIPNASNPIVQTVLDASKAEAEARGYELLISDPGNDLNEQVSVVQSYIQQGVGAIVVVVSEPDVFKPLVEEANAAGVGWVTYAGTLPGEDAYVTWPHKEGGALLGEAAAKWINEQGIDAKVGILTFETGEWARDRRMGIEEALKQGAPDAEIVFSQDALSAPEGIEVVSTGLQAHPDMNVILAIADTASEGAYQALLDAGKSPDDPGIFVGGMDGSKQAMQLMLDKTFYRASAALDLPAIGRAIVDTPAEIIENGGAENAIIPYLLVDQSDPAVIEEFLAFYG